MVGGALFGVAAGCLVELEHRVACGDGYTDQLAGEECDPADRPSYELACEQRGFAAGVARCDPTTCQIEATAELCAVCGDGVLSPGEECDGNNLANKKCLSGADLVTCNQATCTYDLSACPACGNGVVDPAHGEECDWNVEPGEIADPEVVECAELQPLGEIQYKGYASGEVPVDTCTTKCRFPRDKCSFCGDGVVDKAYTDIGGPDGDLILKGAEVCDGKDVEPERLIKHCREVCTGDALSTLNLRCDFECINNCGALVSPEPAEARCCVLGGDSCDPVLPCCFALDNPGEDGCAAVLVETPNGTIFVDRCRSL